VDGVPDLTQVRAWVGVPSTAVSDEDLQQILDAEQAIQARTCRLPEDTVEDPGTYPAALARALLRRCQRQVAVRNLPLGALGLEGTEYGPMTLPSWDAEISRLEASYRIPVVACAWAAL
jgi:hypothetical protein